jgi:hypothetical protein
MCHRLLAGKTSQCSRRATGTRIAVLLSANEPLEEERMSCGQLAFCQSNDTATQIPSYLTLTSTLSGLMRLMRLLRYSVQIQLLRTLPSTEYGVLHQGLINRQLAQLLHPCSQALMSLDDVGHWHNVGSGSSQESRCKDSLSLDKVLLRPLTLVTWLPSKSRRQQPAASRQPLFSHDLGILLGFGWDAHSYPYSVPSIVPNLSTYLYAPPRLLQDQDPWRCRLRIIQSSRLLVHYISFPPSSISYTETHNPSFLMACVSEYLYIPYLYGVRSSLWVVEALPLHSTPHGPWTPPPLMCCRSPCLKRV